MIELIEYCPGDENLIDPHTAFSHKEDPMPTISFCHYNGWPMRTLVSEHGPVAIVGICPVGGSLWEAWGFTDKRICRHIFSFSRSVRDLLDFYGGQYGIKRYHLYVKSGFKWADKFARLFGFKPDDIISGLAWDGGSMNRYVRD